MSDLTYDIREVEEPEIGLRFDLIVEGQRITSATAANSVIEDMAATLGYTREDVAEELKRSLESLLKNQLARVTLSEVRETANLRYAARFTYRSAERISTGIAWYDVQSSETGPTGVPAIVRNKLRFEVHKLLTTEGTHARAIVELRE